MLKRILLDATVNVPAYRPYHQSVLSLKPEEALTQFPLLDKTTLRQNFKDYLSTKFPARNQWSSTTGGTTGEQLQFILDDGAQSREMAFIHRIWSQIGYTPNSRKATFRGVEFRNLISGKYWQDNPIYNECQFSPFHLGPQTITSYIEQLKAFPHSYLHGYPSAISLLAELMQQNGLSLPVRGVLLGSEAIWPEQRELIEQVFNARVLSWYGHSERVILAGECEVGNTYHAMPDYGWLEIVNEQGQPVSEGETGELVGTGFWNSAMPLIRYRTGDRARRLSRKCDCGRNFERFDSVEGRWKQEYVLGRSGARISVAALNMHGPFYDRVIRYQYYQNQPGQLELRLLPAPGFDSSDIEALRQAFKNRIHGELDIVIKIVDDIPLTARGKLRRLIQEIPNTTPTPM